MNGAPPSDAPLGELWADENEPASAKGREDDTGAWPDGSPADSAAEDEGSIASEVGRGGRGTGDGGRGGSDGGKFTPALR